MTKQDNAQKKSKYATELLVRERKERVATCEQAVMSVLKKHKCRLMTVQQFIDGQAQPIQVIVAALD